ncbi:hypothetical protein [Catenibacterium mitsuokai]|uniref:hypothetical protein n=1 Tax=Catenibacterium mitsuokai TaxID=100886 RepID=UPI003F8C6989
MKYNEILRMVNDAAENEWYRGNDYENLKKVILRCATDIYIEQMKAGTPKDD